MGVVDDRHAMDYQPQLTSGVDKVHMSRHAHTGACKTIEEYIAMSMVEYQLSTATLTGRTDIIILRTLNIAIMDF